MTKSIIVIFAISSILLTTTLTTQATEEDLPIPQQWGGTGSTEAIPDWVDQNFRWYGEGLIEQSELVNAIKYLIENQIMVLEPTSHAEDNAPIESGKLLETMKEGDAPYWVDITMPDGTSNSCSCWDKTESTTSVGPVDSVEAVTVEKGRAHACPAGENCFQVQVTSYVEAQEVASQKIKELLAKGETTSQDWQEVIDELAAIQGTDTTDSVSDYLQAVVVLCSTAIDKEIFALQSEISLLEELSDMHADVTDRTTEYSGSSDQSNLYDVQQWITKKTSSIDSKIQSLQTGIKVLEETLASTGDDAQLANIDLQNALQKQQQILQTMSNVSKMLHDTGMAIIRKIG